MAGSERHILLIGGEGGPSGVPTYLRQMAAALSGMDLRLTVVSDIDRGGYGWVRESGLGHAEIAGLRSGLNPAARAGTARALGALIEETRPDLVWPHARMAVQLTRLLALRMTGFPPLAVTYHGLPFGAGHRPGTAALALRAERAFLRRLPPHDLVFLSEGARARFAAALGPGRMAGHRAHVLENCSDLGPLPRSAAPGRPERVMAMTGRAGWQKDLGTAARVMAALGPDWRLILCGAGTQSWAVRQRFARAMGRAAAEARVDFRGPVADVRPVLAAADCYLLSSRYEGMPIGALEAFEAGLPLVLADIPGTEEIRAAHPRAVTLPRARPEAAAPAIEAAVTRYLSDPAGEGAAIRAAWGARFAPARWQAGMRALVTKMLERPTGAEPGAGAGPADIR